VLRKNQVVGEISRLDPLPILLTHEREISAAWGKTAARTGKNPAATFAVDSDWPGQTATADGTSAQAKLDRAFLGADARAFETDVQRG